MAFDLRRILRADHSVIRGQSTRSVLTKTDRILSGNKGIDVVIKDGMSYPAWTDGQIITLNSSWEPLKEALKTGHTPQSILIATALNYHELAHCMFTPRLRSDFVEKIKEGAWFPTFNILEDQAAETRFVKLYNPARHYFTALVARYMDVPEYHQENYVLVSGRLFLPQRLRDKFRERFKFPKLLDDIDSLIARYKQLISPDDDREMLEIIEELHNLLYPNLGMMKLVKDHNLELGNAKKKLAQELDDLVDEFVNSEDRKEDDDEDTDQAEGSGDEQAKEKGQPQDQQGESPGSPDVDDSEHEDDQDPEDLEQHQDLENTLDQIMDQVLAEVGDELYDRLEAIRDHEGGYEVPKQLAFANYRSPNQELFTTIERCREEFRRIQIEASPGWRNLERTGKINPRHYARALRGAEYVHRRWREGVHDALDYEVVFMLDISSSMNDPISTGHNKIYEASTSLWVLQQVFDEFGGISTVLGFHGGMELLSQRGTKSDRTRIPTYVASGGTNPEKVLHETRRLLGVSKKQQRLAIIITDGQFANRSNAISLMNSFNDPIVIVGIKTHVEKYKKEANTVIHAQTINQPYELVDVVKNAALALAQQRLAQKGYQ